MGQVNLTPIQKEIFEFFSKEKISHKFYFTGGTALSAFYLNHRQSDDLDFFSEHEFDTNSTTDIMQRYSKAKNLPFRFTSIENTRVYELVKDEKLLIKVDFAYYPYKRLEKGSKQMEIEIDTIKDIAVNKIVNISQRTEVKDYVDLYFLLQKHTVWDLLYGVEVKFGMEMDLVLLASDFLKIDEFEYLPRMILPLELSTLKDFFRKKAKEMGGKIILK